jgi:hypothetical protein
MDFDADGTASVPEMTNHLQIRYDEAKEYVASHESAAKNKQVISF